MFNLGNGDKEKLEENMEEIKQLVNEGKDSGEEDENIPEKIEGITGPDESFQQEFSGVQDNPNLGTDKEVDLDDQPSFNQGPEADNSDLENKMEKVNINLSQKEAAQKNQITEKSEDRRNELDEEFEEMQEELQKEIKSIKETQNRHAQQRQHTENEKSVRNKKEMQKEEVDYNDQAEHSIDSQPKEPSGKNPEEPLFLEVDSFEDMKQMVEEMHYLTTEMDDVINHLEAGIEEDQETMTEAGQIVNEFESRRENIQETLKNK